MKISMFKPLFSCELSRTGKLFHSQKTIKMHSHEFVIKVVDFSLIFPDEKRKNVFVFWPYF